MVCLWCVLVLLTLLPASQSTDAGVKVRLTQKALEYGQNIGITYLQQKLGTIKVPDISGSESVFPIGEVQYRVTGMQIVSLGLPQSAVGLVPGTAVSFSIGNAFINMHGNWRVKYSNFIKDSGSFDLSVNDLTISTSIAIRSDETGRPAVNSAGCSATVGNTKIKLHSGASWLYNLFSFFTDKILGKALERQICPLVVETIVEMNHYLKSLNVLAEVDEYAEIEYPMVASPVISKSSIDFSLMGEFHSTGQHHWSAAPFSPTAFSLPPQDSNMLYIGLSAFTVNSAAFVYHTAGALSLYITDDLIPPSIPIRLSTITFGAFIPQIAKMYPGLMMKLHMKTAKVPIITFQPNNVTVQASSTVTAYAIQPNATLSPLFVLNLDASVSARIYVTGLKVAGSVTLNSIDITLGTSYVGPFQVKSLDNIFVMVLKVAVLPMVNAYFEKGYPLPAIGEIDLINTQLQVLKDYMLLGTDLKFSR
ncbi:bactericidal permeability-increasing protein-like [Chanos chanos]|uniref:Bactericidal permeability-increasing protein n=1 Tax=Chanos chanos TaxID=29144 RepID=A0A6J2VR08_CHACN|nr:bactericidal permeability-increasing protein-like [Chanos chanos]